MRRLVPLTACAVLIAGCGSGDDFNDADGDFATAMILHHADGIQLANMTIGRNGLAPDVAELAEHIRVEQTGEIDRLAGLLEEWWRPVPRTGFGTGDGHTHAESGGASEVQALAEASDAAFERRWLAMMIEHHRGAIGLARDVADEGENDEAAALAKRIAADQESEIAQMSSWLDGH